MKKTISFDYDKEAGLTIATLKTSKGTFYGTSCKHPDDTFSASYSVGTNIAEARAYISLYNKLIANKTLELKGLQRLANAMPNDNEGFKYVYNLKRAIIEEKHMLKEQRAYWKAVISINIEARGVYLRSRSMNKEEKEKMRDTIKKSFEILSNQDKDN